MDFDDDVCDMIMKLEKINETHRKCIDANNEKIAQLKKPKIDTMDLFLRSIIRDYGIVIDGTEYKWEQYHNRGERARIKFNKMLKHYKDFCSINIYKQLSRDKFIGEFLDKGFRCVVDDVKYTIIDKDIGLKYIGL